MHNLRHFYYQNKQKIWKVVLIIAFLLGIIYYLNGQVGEDENSNINLSENTNVIYTDEENKTYISDKSAIYGETITDYQVEKINNTISKFLQHCKNGNTEEAYKMVSDDCKENKYKTLEKFKEKYLKSRFDKNSIYEIQKWIGDTYKISISKDLLATGNINDNEKIIEYITIVTENSEDKLNINSYIGKTDINKETTQDKIKLTVINKKQYMDYEIYNLKIENLSNKTIKLDPLQKSGTIYLKDSKGNKYKAYSHEISGSDLEIKSNNKFNISIKFANAYSNRVEIDQIVFENVILDYIEYKKTENTQNFEDICEIKINL